MVNKMKISPSLFLFLIVASLFPGCLYAVHPEVGEWEIRLCDEGGIFYDHIEAACEEWYDGTYTDDNKCVDGADFIRHESEILPRSSAYEIRVRQACDISQDWTGWRDPDAVDTCYGTATQYVMGVEKTNYGRVFSSGTRLGATGECNEYWEHGIGARRDRVVRCPSGFRQVGDDCILEDVNPHKNNAVCPSSIGPSYGVGNPIHIGHVYKYQNDIDIPKVSPYSLDFSRYYTSGDHWVKADIGAHWRHSYAYYLQRVKTQIQDGITLYRPNGDRYFFTQDTSGTWSTDNDIHGSLEETPTGYIFKSPDNTQEIYDIYGKITSINNISGHIISFEYDASDRIFKVTNDLGEFIEFAYNSRNLISGVVDSSGRTWEYRYDNEDNLQFVIYPDATQGVDDNPSLEYHYNEQVYTSYSNRPHALTGITDERGIRYATFEYYANGRAKSSYHSNDINRVDVTYNDSNGYRTVVNSRDQKTIYSTEIHVGVRKISSVSGPGCTACGEGGDVNYQYDPTNNNLLSKTENGLTTEYGDYDIKGQYGYKIEAAGTDKERRTDYTYDPRFYHKVTERRAPSVYPGAEKVTTYAYDEWGNRLTETVDGFDPDGTPITRTTTYAYDGPLHQLSFVDGPRTDVNDFTYYRYYPNDPAYGDDRGRLQEVEDAHGVKVRHNLRYTATGKLRKEHRGDLRINYYYYPGNDRLKQVVETDTVTGAQRKTLWTYLATGEVETITQGYGTSGATTITLGYDDARRLTRITDGLGNYIEYTLDTEGNRTGEKIYDAAGSLKKQLTQTFDRYNRLDLTTQLNESVDRDFAPDGTLDAETDGKGSVTDYDYDALRRLTQVHRDINGTDPVTANATTTYDYDAQDNLIEVIDPIDGATSYAYDDLGNLVSQTSPDTGTTTFQYDAADNLTQRTDAKGQVFTYSYDALNRLIAIDGPGAVSDITYTYDNCPNGQRRLCHVKRAGEDVEYAYDAFGNVTVHQDVTYTYDAANRVSTMTYPSGAMVSYQYDAAGQVSRVQLTRDGVTQDLASTITHESLGPLTTLSYGNGLSLIQDVDTAYRMTEQTVTGVQEFVYDSYDAAGNLNRRTDTLASAISNFDYDALNRLESATGPFGVRDYGYDGNGNRTRLVADGELTEYSYEPETNRLATATLDENGNTRFQGSYYFTYTPDNRLKTVYVNWRLAAEYAYNGLGQRTRKQTTTALETYRYGLEGQLLVRSYDGGGTLREYIYLDGQPLAVLDTAVGSNMGPALVQASTPAQHGGVLDVAWSGIPNPSATDWVGVFEPGAPATAYLDWIYTGGTTAGSGSLELNHTNLTPGETYELRLYANNSYTQLAAGPNLTLDPAGPTVIAASTPAIRGQSLEVAWSGIDMPTPTDWIGIFAPGSTGLAYMDWVYTGGASNGTASLPLNNTGLVVGETYEVRLYANDGYTQLPQGGTFVLGSDGNEAATSDLYYVHNDRLGTPKALTDEAGATVWSATHDPFGEATVNEDPDGDGIAVTFNLRFPGQYYDGETGLHYNYYRYYDPSTGRYITSDPIGLNGGLNTYAYVGGNPLSFIDPLGLECTAVNGTVTCNVPGGPQISFPQPAGWPSSLKPGDSNYHYYNKWVNLPPGVDKQCVEDYLKNHPTPGSPSPATPEGTPNDASPNWAAPFKSSPVKSYTMTSNGSPVVVNVTLPGHPLFPGYVARDVSGGVVNNFGEGTGWLQGPNSPFSGPINNVWYGLTDDAIKACSCQQ